MHNKILTWILLFIVTVSALISWFSIDRAIFDVNASDFWRPLFWVSIFAITFSLSAAIVRNSLLVQIALAISLILGLIFTQDIFHIVIIIVAWLVFFLAEKGIKVDIKDSIKINLLKSLPRGSFLIVVGITLVITSQYFLSIKGIDSSKITPNISRTENTINLLNFILPWVNPQFKEVKSEEMNIDNFLGDIYETMALKIENEKSSSFDFEDKNIQVDEARKKIETELGRKLTEDEARQFDSLNSGQSISIQSASPQIKESIVSEWKKELSKSAGFEIHGEEKVADVFVSIVNYKINDFFEPNVENSKSEIIPIIFSIILFLSLLSMGTFISRFWIFIAFVIFWLLKKAKIIQIDRQMKEVEIIL